MRARATLALHAARASRGPKSLASSRSSELAGDTFFRIVSEHGPGVADLSLTYRPRGACEEYDADGAVAAAIGHGEDDGASTPRVTEINGRKGWRPACERVAPADAQRVAHAEQARRHLSPRRHANLGPVHLHRAHEERAAAGELDAHPPAVPRYTECLRRRPASDPAARGGAPPALTRGPVLLPSGQPLCRRGGHRSRHHTLRPSPCRHACVP
jgi:hypothetical protein